MAASLRSQGRRGRGKGFWVPCKERLWWESGREPCRRLDYSFQSEFSLTSYAS